MDDFNKVGRLKRPQFLPSTRGFGLDGKEILFKTPIKPKPYRKRRKRAKQGKIMFDTAQARWYRNQNLYGSQRGARIFRNSQNVGLNEDERGLTRPDLDRRIILQIESNLEDRRNRDLEDLERLRERVLPQRNLRRPPPLPAGRIPIIIPDVALREDALDNNEARGVVAGLEGADAPSPIERGSNPASLLGGESVEEVGAVGPTPRQQYADVPLAERSGEARYDLRDLPAGGGVVESEQGSAWSDPDYEEPSTTHAEFVDIQSDILSREREEEERRRLAIRRDIEAGKQSLIDADREASETFRQRREARRMMSSSGSSEGSVGGELATMWAEDLVRKTKRRQPIVEESEMETTPEFDEGGMMGGVDGYSQRPTPPEREVRRELGDPTLQDKAEERKQSRLGGLVKKVKQSLRSSSSEEATHYESPFDDAEFGLNPTLNPLNAPSEVSSEATD